MLSKVFTILPGVLCATLLFATESAAQCVAPTCAKIINNGADAGKKVVVVMGDGYTAAEQEAYNTQVNELVTTGLFGNDFFREQHNAFNVYRLNLNSTESGVSQIQYDEKGTSSDPDDDTIISQTARNTALRYVYSGSWAHCWLQHQDFLGINLTESLKASALKDNGLSHADYVIVLLNEPGPGGCNRGPRDIVQTRTSSWQVVGHEAGHGIGGLRDEYSASGKGAYSGAMVNTRNCSTVVNRDTVLWNRFISPATALPSTLMAGMDSNRTVGMFNGCGTYESGLYRPVHNCRMKGNTPHYCPVCQTLMRQSLYTHLDHDFNQSHTGDFDGDGRTDVLIQNGNDLAIYRSRGGPYQLDRVWTANNLVPSALGSSYSWALAAGDKLFVADFNGDGKDDVYVLNTTSWGTRYLGMLRSNGTGLETVIHYGGTIPGYGSIGAQDQLFVADFDADNKDDLYLFTAGSWSTRYLGMLKSSGTALSTVERYDGSIPGWSMTPRDRFYVADFDGDNRSDLYVFNGVDWSFKYLGMMRTTGTALSASKVYTTTLASGWNMGANDQHFVGDIDGDGKDDLYVFNGADWGVAYLELTKSSGTTLDFVKRYDDDASTAWATNVPGWTLKPGDRFTVSDANKDGKADLFVLNVTDWNPKYLGTLMSSSTALSGSWTESWIQGTAAANSDWGMGTADQIQAVNYEGGAGKADIFIRNANWFGMVRRGAGGFALDRIYYRWIYSPLHDSKPWSDQVQ